jgi:L,D-peptidoglycan transpeptidase YkuD (ErfK/YbiS/YcfS/YnhG family)
MPPRLIRRLLVVPSIANRSRGALIVGSGARFPCAIGRSGVRVDKREGDGATPVAPLPIRRVFIRPDKGPAPLTRQPRRWMSRADAWCDDMADRRYNRLIRRPEGEAEERLWRTDHLYDIVIELGWNDRPVRRGRGSAIFWHLPRPGFTPTAGCIATTRDVFMKVLPRLAKDAVIRVTSRA